MKIISWNVNSLRARFERTCALLRRHEPDVLCLQETKLLDEQFPLDEFRELGYHAIALGQKSYNGVAILSREEPDGVVRGFPGDPERRPCRVIGAEIAGVQVFDLYVVNGKDVEHPDYQLKLQWLDAFNAWLGEAYDPATPLLLTGDFNIAPADIDVHDPEAWRGKNLCSEPERERLRGLFGGQLRDLFRERYPDEQRFTWWDYRNGAFHKNLGLRIDLALATPPVADRCLAVEVDREERKPSTGEGKPSDHAP
ncbi:MAG: exodeoxyribonuclease III [Dehalococcoidia bacterium]|nr:exodeoxyribonuclease III [Dehalococcoidia bacterium]